jgi:hypothetical protein
MLSTVKALILLTIAFFVARPFLRRRWPDFTKRVNLALIAALIAVILFRFLIWLSRS